MTNVSKARGTRFETQVVDYLRAHGFPYAERRALRGTKDCGDITGLIGWVLELKNHRQLDLGGWATEATKEAVNDGGSRWAVIHKRRMKPVSEAYVTLPLRTFVELVREDD